MTWRSILAVALALAWPELALAQSAPDAAPAETTAAPRQSDRPANAADERPHRRRRHREGSNAREFDLIWFGPEIGLSVVDLKMISYDGLLPEQVDVRETGLGFGAAAGVKLKILSVGLHLNVGQFAEFDVWTLNLDGQLRIPLGAIEPYLRLGIGYAFLGAFDADLNDVDAVDGWDLKAGFGIDLYANDYLSLGGGIDFTILNLTSTASPTAVDFTRDGAAVGVGVFFGGRAALHF
jgi:hypothetical protein